MSPFIDLHRQLFEPSNLRANSRVVASDGARATPVSISFGQKDEMIHITISNHGGPPVRLREAVLFDGPHGLPPDTRVYGEGFTMLAQTGGTLGGPEDIGSLPDRTHYRIPEPGDLRTVYGVMTLATAGAHLLIGFASCRRFMGRIGFDARRLRVSLDLEDKELMPGEEWAMEDLLVVEGESRERLLERFADSIAVEHPRLAWPSPPTGWCSWYCFGASVTVPAIRANLEWMGERAPQLRYVQIDDGYQSWMGDWLERSDDFGGDVRDTLRLIRERGFEPAIWVAPFVASPESRLFAEHPDWFVRDEGGRPLSSARDSFGGWRLGPWYALDGTHPEARGWLTGLFRAMREEWGVAYFKLDANFWGALHGGHRFDPDATRVEAYRRGMEAILAGAQDAFVLGCNHPMWPSLGLIHGSRSSGDIARDWPTIVGTGRENLHRGWQNGRLWWNDPDCVVLGPTDSAGILDGEGNEASPQRLSDQEYLFHATIIYASGGMLLSGDNLPRLTARQAQILHKLLPPTGRCAEFEDSSLSTGTLSVAGKQVLVLLNWSDGLQTRIVDIPDDSLVTDFWTDEPLNPADLRVLHLPPHESRLLIIESVERS